MIASKWYNLVKCLEDRAQRGRTKLGDPEDIKLRELILYVAARSEGDHWFGKTKLHKVLFYSDVIFYAETGRSITGQEYQKYPHGPFGSETPAALQALESEHAVAIGHRDVFGHRQERPFALREPNLDDFSGKEIAIVDEVIGLLWDRSASEVSELSHRFIGWQVARDYEVIPYEMALVDTSEPTEEELEYAKQLVAAGR
jgi:hypothetical protein